MSRALLIVDVQSDLTEGGALAITGGDAGAQLIESGDAFERRRS